MGAHAQSGYHTYVGVKIALGDVFKAVTTRSQWGYKGNLELNPGSSIVTGFGDASADIDFTAHATQHKAGQNDVKSVAQLSSQNIDTAVKDYKMSASGSASRSIPLSSGNKTVEFTFDMRAALSVDAPPGDAAEAAFQFGPKNNLSMNFGTRQTWVYTLKKGYTLSSCG